MIKACESHFFSFKSYPISDNTFDNWIFKERQSELEITPDLDYDPQTIKLKDNSDGIKEEGISLIVGTDQLKVSKIPPKLTHLPPSADPSIEKTFTSKTTFTSSPHPSNFSLT